MSSEVTQYVPKVSHLLQRISIVLSQSVRDVLFITGERITTLTSSLLCVTLGKSIIFM